MESIDVLTKRLDTMRELRSLTGTMRDLSAVNVRQFENAAKSINEHASVIELGLQALAINTDQPPSKPLTVFRGEARVAILIGSDHGLCGRFNERLVSYASTFKFTSTNGTGFSLAELSSNDDGIDMHALRIISVGELAARECESQGIRSDTQFTLPGVVESIPQLVRLLLVDLDQWLQQYPAASVSVFHQRTTVKSIEPVHYQLVPVAQNRTTDSPRWPSHKLPGISLSGDKLLIELIREHLFVSLYRACAESQAAEYASRFSSMQSANRNIDDQVNSLEGQMHQQRQATITNELLDTVAGYNSIVQNK